MDQEAVQEVVFPEGHSNSLPVPGGAREAMTDAVREEIPAVPKTKSTAKIINAQDLQMNWIIGTPAALAFVLYTTVICSIVILQRWLKKMRDASAVSEAQLEVGGCSGTTERWTQRQQTPLPPASPVARPPSQEPLLPTSLSPASLDQQENPSSPVRPQTPPKEPPCHTTPLHQEPFPAAQSPLGAGAAPQTYPLGQFPLEAQDPAAPAEGMCSGGSSRTPHTPRGGQPDHQPQCPASGSGHHPKVTPELLGDCCGLHWSLPRLAQLQKRLARGVSWFLPRRKRRSRRQPRSKASHRAVKRESGKK
ncbi:PREDICTED: uncharacterized protein LOC106899366, partial [Calidris pugnax]|uniref:uncharacterized protein LOC106899366 n=1 Tax=Calidris pugnax TaxID=198806 RepID=UPI00071D03FF